MHRGNGKGPRTRSVLLATGLLVVGIAPFGIAATGDSLREGRRNGTTVRETEIVSNIKSTTALKGGYSTRQSNLSDSGGGAIYGCRSQAGGSRATPTPQNPCIRANNLSQGLAFEFNAANGDTVGAITAGAGGDAKKPFTTNATGVATGLNADRVDNLDADAIVTQARAGLVQPFVQVSSTGTPGQSRGLVGNVEHIQNSGLYGVTFAGDLTKCAVSATLTDALGEIAALPAPAGANTAIAVRTGNSAGGIADRSFHLSVTC
ncbi:MAG: hypothetical protein QOJ89_3588 [bacterium]|jgi:hypothetical protein